MESSQNCNESLKVLVQINNCIVHELSNKKKKLICKGQCAILQKYSDVQMTAKPVQLIRTPHFTGNITEKSIIKIKYEKSYSYIFLNQNQKIMSLSFLIDQDNLHCFESVLCESGKIYDYYSADMPMNVKISLKEHCPDIEDTQIRADYPTAKKIGGDIGSLFGAITGLFLKPSQKGQKIVNQGFNRASSKISEDTKSQWQNVKEKANNVNQSISTLIRPINQKITELTGQISQSYQKSQNKHIKAFKNFTRETTKSINQGYQTAQRQSISEKKESNEKQYSNENSEQINSNLL